MPTSRTEAFSDGVFAVAITLLILNVEVPRVGSEPLQHALTALWPSYAAYAVSFITIGIMWVNHHAVFKRIRVVDRPLQFINLFLLMIVTFIPFPTSLLGRYLQAGRDSGLAAAVYGLVMFLMSIGFVSLWGYAVYHPNVFEPEVDPAAARASLPRFGLGVLIYAACIPIALINAVASLVVFAVIDAYYIFDQIDLGATREQFATEGSILPAPRSPDGDPVETRRGI